jgi:adenine/guanine phosphoribosyltransferase-like PRPP-binding protein
MVIHSDYLHVLFDERLDYLVRDAALTLTQKAGEFDALAVTGNSGAIFGGALAFLMEKPLLLIRKGDAHSSLKWEGRADVTSYIVVDDCISTGATLRRIVATLPLEMKLVGSYTYRDDACSGRTYRSADDLWLQRKLAGDNDA